MTYTTPATAGALTEPRFAQGARHGLSRASIWDFGIPIDSPEHETVDELAARSLWLLANIGHPAVAAGVVQTQEELEAFEAYAAKIRALPGYRYSFDDATTMLLRMQRSP